MDGEGEVAERPTFAAWMTAKRQRIETDRPGERKARAVDPATAALGMASRLAAERDGIAGLRGPMAGGRAFHHVASHSPLGRESALEMLLEDAHAGGAIGLERRGVDLFATFADLVARFHDASGCDPAEIGVSAVGFGPEPGRDPGVGAKAASGAADWSVVRERGGPLRRAVDKRWRAPDEDAALADAAAMMVFDDDAAASRGFAALAAVAALSDAMEDAPLLAFHAGRDGPPHAHPAAEDPFGNPNVNMVDVRIGARPWGSTWESQVLDHLAAWSFPIQTEDSQGMLHLRMPIGRNPSATLRGAARLERRRAAIGLAAFLERTHAPRRLVDRVGAYARLPAGEALEEAAALAAAGAPT